jgi:hypothetical protein
MDRRSRNEIIRFYKKFEFSYYIILRKNNEYVNGLREHSSVDICNLNMSFNLDTIDT